MTNEFPVHLSSQFPSESSLARARESISLRSSEGHSHSYSVTVIMAAATGLAHTLIGAVIISVVIHSVLMKDVHAAIFTVAYHFCAVEGILGLSFINGWSTPMRKTHRQYAHAILQTCTVTCAVIGVMAVSIPTITSSRTVHGISGLITLVLTATAWVVGPFLMKWVVGPFVLRGIRPLHIIHKVVGLLCFLMSSVCLSSGIVTNEFSRWVGKEFVSILVVFILFYTFIVIYTSCMKYVKVMF